MAETTNPWEALKNHQAAQKPQPCPHCGYCPTCGRGGYNAYPWYPAPWRPYPYVTWSATQTVANQPNATQFLSGLTVRG